VTRLPNFQNDIDFDGVPDSQDNCPTMYNVDQRDTDRDDIGDPCDTDCNRQGGRDLDCDGVNNERDNCLSVYNPDQNDANRNNLGDACDPESRPQNTMDTIEESCVAADGVHTVSEAFCVNDTQLQQLARFSPALAAMTAPLLQSCQQLKDAGIVEEKCYAYIAMQFACPGASGACNSQVESSDSACLAILDVNAAKQRLIAIANSLYLDPDAVTITEQEIQKILNELEEILQTLSEN